MPPSPTYRGYDVELALRVGERRITIPDGLSCGQGVGPEGNDYISIDVLALDAAIDRLNHAFANRAFPPGPVPNNAILVEFTRQDGALAQAVVIYDPMKGYYEHIEHFTGAGFEVTGNPVDIGPSTKQLGIAWSRTAHPESNVIPLTPGGAETSA
jgi:hypothetical protein